MADAKSKKEVEDFLTAFGLKDWVQKSFAAGFDTFDLCAPENAYDWVRATGMTAGHRIKLVKALGQAAEWKASRDNASAAAKAAFEAKLAKEKEETEKKAAEEQAKADAQNKLDAEYNAKMPWTNASVRGKGTMMAKDGEQMVMYWDKSPLKFPATTFDCAECKVKTEAPAVMKPVEMWFAPKSGAAVCASCAFFRVHHYLKAAAPLPLSNSPGFSIAQCTIPAGEVVKPTGDFVVKSGKTYALVQCNNLGKGSAWGEVSQKTMAPVICNVTPLYKVTEKKGVPNLDKVDGAPVKTQAKLDENELLVAQEPVFYKGWSKWLHHQYGWSCVRSSKGGADTIVLVTDKCRPDKA